jgi:23S rRNA pseudouridine1911/1915/1917 synthase
LASQLNVSRSQISLRIDAGDVLVDGKRPPKAGVKLRGGETLEVTLPPPPPSEAIPEELPIDVIYSDEHLIVVNKASDMVVHPSPGHESGTLVNALLFHFGELAHYPDDSEGLLRPGIVHRLDRGTSGLLVVARNAVARKGLALQLSERSMSRRYLALVHGRKIEDTGTYDTLHGRHQKDRRRFSSRVESGKQAITHWRVLGRSASFALVECRLQTGRTHQIRVHFTDHGHAVVGDALYSGVRHLRGPGSRAINALTHQALHAFRLEFTHPVSGDLVTFEAPPPEDFEGVLETLFDDWRALL